MGPAIAILLNRKIDFEEIHHVDELLKSIVKGEIEMTKSTRDFWVDSSKWSYLKEWKSDCSFSIKFDNKLREMSEDEVLEIEGLLGSKVASQINLSAGCNREADHHILGTLTLEIAQRLDGWIDFGGDINIFSNGICEELDGVFHTIAYNDGLAEYQIMSTAFFENWMKHPDFRIIK